MARPPRWEESDLSYGIVTVTLSSWKYFPDYVHQEMLDYRQYIWRGQRCSSWLLEPTLDRYLRRFHSRRMHEYMRSHLGNFKYATRGRRGANPPSLHDDNDWWALGQHHGLHTPLLDWTASPFVAAYFAFAGQGQDQTPTRAIFALSQSGVQEKNDQLRDKYAKELEARHQEGQEVPRGGIMPPATVDFVRPLSDENARLVNQGGLFTRAPVGVDVESWIKQNFAADERYFQLIKITIPNTDRQLCLRSLNRMNINHLTLFPDLYGASKYCNMDLEIEKY